MRKPKAVEQLVVSRSSSRRRNELVKFVLKEDLPSCLSAAAVLIDETDRSSSGSVPEFSIDLPYDHSEADPSLVRCGCREGDEIIVHDSVGLAISQRTLCERWAPRGAMGWARRSSCHPGEYEIVSLGLGCCDAESGSESGCDDRNCVTIEAYETRCEDGKLKRCRRTTSICSNGDGSLTKFETACEDVEGDYGCCACCCSDSASSGSDSGDPPREGCPECNKAYHGDNPKTVSMYFSSLLPKLTVQVSCDADCEEPWCKDEVRRFNVTLTNPIENGIGRIFLYSPRDGGWECASGQTGSHAPVSVSFFEGSAQFFDCQYAIYANHGPGAPALALPGVYGVAYIGIPCTELLVGESTTFWFELKALEDFVSGNARPVGITVGFTTFSFGNTPARKGVDLEYYCITGRCCLPDGSCVNTSDDECATLGGVWTEGVLCGSSPCLGRCCKDGACSTTTKAGCDAIGGTWYGPGTNCSGPPCPL